MSLNTFGKASFVAACMIGLLGLALYLSLRPHILKRAYQNGRTAIVPAKIYRGQKGGSSGVYVVDGEEYSATLAGMADYNHWDSIDILYLRDYPSYSLPAEDIIDSYRRSLNYSYPQAKLILKNYGFWTNVKIYMEDKGHGSFYTYSFVHESCRYTHIIGAVQANPDMDMLRDSVQITYWPVNPNLNMFSAYVREPDNR